MKIYELLQFNKELLNRLCSAGIKPEDYKYADLFTEYERLNREGEKKTYIVATLADKYRISERQVYAVIGRLSQELHCTAGSV
uniref:hypothetical protein n=1 Tax=Bacteroides uniformis TaxID=820 RepID=UPI003FF10C43